MIQENGDFQTVRSAASSGSFCAVEMFMELFQLVTQLKQQHDDIKIAMDLL